MQASVSTENTNMPLLEGKTLKSFLASLSQEELRSIALGFVEEDQNAHDIAQLASFLYGLAHGVMHCKSTEELVKAIEALQMLASFELARRGKGEVDYFLSGKNPWDYNHITLITSFPIKETKELPFSHPTIVKINPIPTEIQH